MMYYESLLSKAEAVTLDEQILRQQLERGRLDSLYVYLSSLERELVAVRPLLSDTDLVEESRFAAVLEHLNVLIDRILAFYEQLSTECPFVGAEDAHERPDVIVVLGCRSPILDSRVANATAYASSFPGAVIVFSGGGTNAATSEAKQMREEAARAGLENVMFKEEDSMDTLGNALFTKFLLRGERLFDGISRITVVTSCFHVLRALCFFETVFNNVRNQFRIAVRGVRAGGCFFKRARHELMSEHITSVKLGIFNRSKDIVFDDRDILLKLLLYHDMYRYRYDLLRKYLKYPR